MALEVAPDASLIVRAPNWLPLWKIKRFINSKLDWIEKHQNHALIRQNKTVKNYKEGEQFLYLGQNYKLEIGDWQNVPLFFDNGFKLARQNLGEAKEIFEVWYKKEAHRFINQRVCYYSEILGQKAERIRISNARRRWGSASATGRINFSWCLVKAPPEIINYVVVHELVHLIHHNHSQRFWAQVAEIIPNYKENRRWLRENGHLLHV